MKSAIEFAWQENLKEIEDDQWKNKEEFIENFCPSEFGYQDMSPCTQRGDDFHVCYKCWQTKEVKKATYKKFEQEIREANNKYLKEVHKEFINTHELNIQDALILSKFLEFMIKHE